MRALILTVFLTITIGASAQQIIGPTTVYVGGQDTFTFDDGNMYFGTVWTTDMGSVQSSSQSFSTYTAVIQWPSTPTSGYVRFRDETNDITVALFVNVVNCASTANVTGGGTYCSPGVNGTSINLSSSQTGVSYQLRLNGVATGGLVSGNGSPITWSQQTAVGTYTVQAIGSGGCTKLMNGSATIGTTQGSVGGTITSSASEVYGSQSISLSLSNNNVGSFSWEMSTGSGWTAVVGATGTPISINGFVASTQVRAVSVNGSCPPAYSNLVTISYYPPIIVNGAQPTITFGNSFQLTVQSTYFSYQWYRNNLPINGATSQQYTVTTPGAYVVKVKGSATASEASSQIINIMAPLYAQTNLNYHVTTTIKKAGQTTNLDIYSFALKDFSQQVIYSDGLGRSIQQVANFQSPAQKDVIAPAKYDNNGQASTQFLPYSSNSYNGTFRNAALNGAGGYSGSEQYGFYQTATAVAHDAYPYAKTTFDNSPLARVAQQGAPGSSWQPNGGHMVVQSVVVNSQTSANSALKNIRLWAYNSTAKSYEPAGITSYYATGELLASKTVDENGNAVYQFADKQGHTILKRVQLDEIIEGSTVSFLDTYYVYDNLGNLVMQVPPRAVAKYNAGTAWSLSFRDEWCFVYTYDRFNNLVEKRTPKQAPSYYIYDPLGRLILSQDGNMRLQNKWSFVKYNFKGQVVMTGLYRNTTKTTRSQVQKMADTLYTAYPAAYYENRGTSLHGYTNTSFPRKNGDNTALQVFSVNYYDDYDFDFNGTADFSYTTQGITGEGTQASSFGLPTGSKRIVLGTSTWLYNYVFYDQLARPIQMRSNNHLSATIDNLVTSVFDFEGKIVQIKTYHNAGGANQTTVVNKYQYDHAGRLLQIYQNNNSAPTDQLVAQYAYNELGQLIDKKLHYTGSGFLQSVDYRYHIRGWLQSINNAQLTNDGTMNDDLGDYFGMEVAYNTSAGMGNTPYYNGNISAVKWKTSGEAAGTAGQRSYTYTYDKSEKLKQATFQAYGTTLWNKEVNTLDESMTYDHNGNMVSLTRKQNQRGLSGTTVTSTSQTLDGLTYTYANGFGNRLTKVEDTGLTDGFKNGISSNNEYKYDTLGNLTQDKNKGVDSVKYTELGQVKRVKFSDGRSIDYLYDAAGAKLTVKNYNTSGVLTTTTQYVGSFVYENGLLSFFDSPEGRVVKNGSVLEYQYAIKDQQGNTRILFTSATPAAATFTATFEGTGGDNSSQFGGVSSIVPNGSANNTAGGSKVVRMNQTVPIAVTKSLRVYAGDKIDLETYCYYEGSGFGTSNVSMATLINTVAGAFGGVSGGAGESGKIYSGVNSGLSSWGYGANQGNNQPSAYLNYILFDQQYRVMDMGWTGVPSTANFAKQKISFSNLNVKEAGFLFVYLSYETASSNWVYFDDLKVTHTKTNIIQSNEYYPFGLQTANSWTRENTTGNNFLSNGGTELNATTSLYDLEYRNYDPQLGRMAQVDPMVDKYSSLTSYNFAFNNPVSFNDPNGADPENGTDATRADWLWGYLHRNDGGGGGGSGATINSFTTNISIDFGSLANGAYIFDFTKGQLSNFTYYSDTDISGMGYSVLGSVLGINYNSSSDYTGGPRLEQSNFGNFRSPEGGGTIPHTNQAYVPSRTTMGTVSPVHGAPDSALPVYGDVRRSIYWFERGDFSRGMLFGISAASDFAGIYGGAKALLKSGARLFLSQGAKGAAKTGLTNAELVSQAAIRAERAVGGTGRFAGTAKHTYATTLLKRYQKIYGNRGLEVNEYFTGRFGRGFLDVHDVTNGIIYDFKFGQPFMKASQFSKYSNTFGQPVNIVDRFGNIIPR